MKKEQGSILLPILLVSTIGLTIALSIASRSLKNLQTTSEFEFSNTAFSAAEAGIEEALYTIETKRVIPTSITTPIPVGAAGGSIKTLTVAEGGGGSGYALDKVNKDDTAEVKLNGYSGSVDLYWDTDGNINQATSLVAMEVSGSSTPYTIKRYALNCGIPAANNFTSVPVGTYAYQGVSYQCRYRVLISSNPQILRIRVMYQETGLAVVAVGGNLPNQNFTITAVGKAGDTERKIQVTRGKPSLPSVFDYVLFSGSSSKSLSK